MSHANQHVQPDNFQLVLSWGQPKPRAKSKTRSLSALDQIEALSAAVDTLTSELLQDEYSPFALGNIVEALAQLPNDAMQVIEQALINRDAKAFKLIADASYNYCNKLAATEAFNRLTH